MINYFKLIRLGQLIQVVAAIMLLYNHSYSQRIENVDFSVTNNNIVVSYSLTGCPSNKSYDVKLYWSADNKYFLAKSVTGDLKKQSCGQVKIITWEVLDDRTELKGNIYVEVKISQSYTTQSLNAYNSNNIKLSGRYIFVLTPYKLDRIIVYNV